MKYNVFRNSKWDGSKWSAPKKMNNVPLIRSMAEDMVADLTGTFKGTYPFYSQTEYVIQGIYPANREGFLQFLDDMGWEENGQHYDSFIYAMENDDLYCM